MPKIGGKKWGIDISEVQAYTIPKLAKGVVIPPNSEFLAILGDQRSGTNIETPERLLRNILREELAGARGNEEINIKVPVYLDDDEIGRAVVKYINRDLLVRKKEIYEELYPETKREATLKQNRNVKITEREKPSFVEDTSQKTGLSKSTIEKNFK